MKSILYILSLFYLSTNVVVSTHSNDDIQILLYETDAIEHSSAKILVDQAAASVGVATKVVGMGTKFEGFGSKYKVVIPALRAMAPDTLVVLSDARDVLINNPFGDLSNDAANEFREQFVAMTNEYPGAVIMSAEAQCCVGALTYARPGDYFDTDGYRTTRACYSGRAPCLWNGDYNAVPWINFMKDLALERMGIGDDLYLNAGLMAGYAGDLLRVFETADVQLEEDDQAVFTDYMYRRPNEILLDYNQALFGNNRHSHVHGCVFKSTANGKRLSHVFTGTTPLFVHSPGGFVSCHEQLLSLLGIDTIEGREYRRKLQDWKLGNNKDGINISPTVATTKECGLFGLDMFCLFPGDGFIARILRTFF